LYIFLGQTQFLIEIHEVYTRQVLARRESSRTLNAELCWLAIVDRIFVMLPFGNIIVLSFQLSVFVLLRMFLRRSADITAFLKDEEVYSAEIKT
jgi:hypothetical protein